MITFTIFFNKILIIFISTYLIFGCSARKKSYSFIKIKEKFNKENKISREDFKTWYHKDINDDSIFGISLDKAYRDLLTERKAEKIIVAVLDTEVNIYHKVIKDQIWLNSDEIPNNNIDDDNNGYVDDINGWNFVGTTQEDSISYKSDSYTRFVKKYKYKFDNKSIENIPQSEKSLYQEYIRALSAHNKQIDYLNERILFYHKVKKEITEATLFLREYIPSKDLSVSKLDSLSAIVQDSLLKLHIKNLKYYNSYDVDINWTKRKTKEAKTELETSLNLDYYDRNTADDLDNILDINYGNNNINGIGMMVHGTKTIGLIGANRNSKSGIVGITNSVKIMPIGIISYGDVFEKDVALAIRYAVDNGAKVINMSFSYDFSTHKNMVYDAIKYANDKDVLLITSSGNSSKNLDIDINYPTDSKNEKEFVSNFLKVGGSNHFLDSTIVSYVSNYGKKEVDIFAPSERIYCITRGENIFHYGTSYASAITSGVAALIRSYYPNLTAAEVKQIIMESGVSYNIMVNKPSTSKEKELVPFSSLSKSGKIVNTYNALLMAEEVSKKKKKKKRN